MTNTNTEAALPDRLHKLLEEGAMYGPHRIAFTDETGQHWSYGALTDAVEAASDKLTALGVVAGDRIVLVCENSISGIAIILAASKIDAATAIVNARQSAREVTGIIEDCAPKCVIFTDVASQAADEHADHVGAVPEDFGAIGKMKVTARDTSSVPFEVHDDPAKQVAVLIYTTGTTGKPKGVMLSHQGVVFVSVRGKQAGYLGFSDTALCLMPIAHSFGLSSMLGGIFASTRLIICQRFNVDQVLELITTGTLTILTAAPVLFKRLVEVSKQRGISMIPNRIRYMHAGTAPLDLNLRNAVEESIGIVLYNGYGLTETSTVISRSRQKIGAPEVNLGPPIAGMEVKVVGEDGAEVAQGAPGELWVRGPNLMIGYYNNRDATEALFDADGFMNTGDVVTQDAEGVLTIEGRSKELIIRSGFNVYPIEVEAQINEHPDVLNSAVVGCNVEDNEAVVAFLELVDGKTLEPEQLQEYLRDKLSAYKVPSHVFVVDELPYSPNAKILKGQLKEWAAARLG